MQRGKEMIREKMFRLHRHKSSSKSDEKLEFTLSNIHALQVPKGWDKLYVSLLSTETGKLINKSGKASVRDGKCHWTETLSEFVQIPQDKAQKEPGQCFLKLVVAMGSTRGNILGEATINLTSYMSSDAAVFVSLPLKRCSYGTILQIEIQCLTPRSKDRYEKGTNSFAAGTNSDYDDSETKSEVSDCSFTLSISSSSGSHLDAASHQGDLSSRQLSFSASGSRPSLDSVEGSFSREIFTPQSNTSTVPKHVIGRQESTGSQFSAPYDSPRSDISGSGNHLQNQRENVEEIPQSISTSSLHYGSYRKSPVENEEFQREAKAWEKTARKLMLDQESLRQEFEDQSRQLASLNVELSSSRAECDVLKQEIEQLKIRLVESGEKQKAIENSKFQYSNLENMQTVLEDELRFQKQSNDSLVSQLNKTQDSNLELVSILQEMEETIEKQRIELQNCSMHKSVSHESDEMYFHRHADGGEKGGEDVSVEKLTTSCNSDMEGSTMERVATGSHAGSEHEESLKLQIKLEELQKSHKNLENTILCLEKNLEDRNNEIEVERGIHASVLLDSETEWKHKLTLKEEEIINLEARLSKVLSAEDSKVAENGSKANLNLLKEIKALQEKVLELETDCNELTTENLTLMIKLKDAETDRTTNNSAVSLGYEESKQNPQTCQPKEELPNGASDDLRIGCMFDESESKNLVISSPSFRDITCHLDDESQISCAEAGEQENEVSAADHTVSKSSESPSSIKFSKLPSLLEQLHLFLVNMKKQQLKLCSPVDTKQKDPIENLECTDLTSQMALEEAVLENLVQLNEMFKAMVPPTEDNCFIPEEVTTSRKDNEVNHKLKDSNLNRSSNGMVYQDCLSKELEFGDDELSQEMLTKSQIEEPQAGFLLKKQEIGDLWHRQREMEIQISDLQKSNDLKEKCIETLTTEKDVVSECVGNLKNDLAALSSSLESHVSEKRVLERKVQELESINCELERHLSELEEENVLLSGSISGLEAQVRYLTNAKEASSLELQHSASRVVNLQDDMKNLEIEIEAQRVCMKQQLDDMQKRWLDAQEECEYLKKANPKLQATTESLIEECSSLQKVNRDLRQQKIELNKHCTALEGELKKFQDSFSNCSKNVDVSEAKFSAIFEEITSKEKIMISDLQALHQRNKEYEEKLSFLESLLTCKLFENAAQLHNLQGEAAPLTAQVSETCDKREGSVRASGHVLESNALHADKGRFEGCLEEVLGNCELSQVKLEASHLDCKTKILSLMTELVTSTENHETLVSNHKKLLELLEDVRSNEEKLKGSINELVLKLKNSEHESLQLAEENSSLKMQVEKIPLLQDEVLAMKASLYGTNFEKERLQASLQLLSADIEKLKAENTSLVERVSILQKAASELDHCKINNVRLEEKVLRLEGDLIAKEASSAQDAELKNELGRIRRVNSQFQRKIKCLEEEKEECLQRAQALEEKITMQTVIADQVQPGANYFLEDPSLTANDASINQKLEEVDNIQLSKSPSPKFSGSQENQGADHHQRKDCCERVGNTKSSPDAAVDTAARIQFLENELSEALEAINMYKVQLKSLMSQEENGEKSDVPNKAIVDGGNEKDASLLEKELKDIRERYSDMSLKYAEVEAQKNQLVLKLKTANNSGKKWFS